MLFTATRNLGFLCLFILALPFLLLFGLGIFLQVFFEAINTEYET